MTPQQNRSDWDDIPSFNSGKRPQPGGQYRADIMGPRKPLNQQAVDNGYGQQAYRAARAQQQPAQQVNAAAVNTSDDLAAFTTPEQHQYPYQKDAFPGAYVSTAQQSVAPSSQSKSGHKKKVLAGALAAAAILFLGGGSAAAYYGYVLPNKPENVLLASMAKTFDLNQLKSVRYSGVFELSGADIPEEIRGVTMEGEATETGGVSVAMTLDTSVAKPKVSIVSADTKSIFVQLSGISGIENILKSSLAGSEYEPMVNQLAPAIAQLNDQWYEFDTSMLGSLEDGSDGAASSLPNGISKDDMAKIAQAYADNRFLKVIQVLGDEQINGSDAKHMKVEVQPAVLKQFISTVKNAGIQNLQLSDKNISDAHNQIDRIDFTKYPIDMWVDKKTKFMSQMQVSVSENGMTLTSRLTLKDHNAAISITKPENAKSLMELYGEVAPNIQNLNIPGGMDMPYYDESSYDNEIEPATIEGKEAIADINALHTALEVFFTSYGGYPSTEDLQSKTWRAKYLQTALADVYVDPAGGELNNGGTYSYVPDNGSGACVTPSLTSDTTYKGKVCSAYVLTATIDGKTYSKSSLN